MSAERPSLCGATYAEKNTQWENSDGMQDAAHVCGRQCGQTIGKIQAVATLPEENAKPRTGGQRAF